jgi:hypothetical protein
MTPPECMHANLVSRVYEYNYDSGDPQYLREPPLFLTDTLTNLLPRWKLVAIPSECVIRFNC